MPIWYFYIEGLEWTPTNIFIGFAIVVTAFSFGSVAWVFWRFRYG